MILQNKSFSSSIEWKFKTLPSFMIFFKCHKWHTQETLYFKRVNEENCYIILFRAEVVSEERGAVV